VIPSCSNRATTGNRLPGRLRPSEKSARRRAKRGSLVARLWKLQAHFDHRRAEALAGGAAFHDDEAADGVRDAWGRIVSCGKSAHVKYVDGEPESPLRQCDDHGTYYRTLGCNHALCPVCQRKRANKLIDLYASDLVGVMATLTQPAKPAESAQEAYDRFRAGWRSFLRELNRPLFAPWTAPNRGALAPRSSLAGRRAFGAWAVPNTGLPQGPSATAAQLMGLDLSELDLGGLLSVEWKERADGWHVHGHALLNQRAPGWALRLCWALAHVDRRTRGGKAAALALYRQACQGAAAGRAKRRNRRPDPPRLVLDRIHLADRRLPLSVARVPGLFESGGSGGEFQRWAVLCSSQVDRTGARGVPAIVDVRRPRGGLGEGLKYACKGAEHSYHPDRDAGLSDGQLVDLILTLPNLRRSTAFGPIERKEEEAAEDYEEGCPICSEPVRVIDAQTLDDHVYSRIPPAWELRELSQQKREAEQDRDTARGETLQVLAGLTIDSIDRVAFGFLPQRLARDVRLLPGPRRGLVVLDPRLRSGRLLWGGLLHQV
jgi:hypothetical protein